MKMMTLVTFNKILKSKDFPKIRVMSEAKRM